jgi:hypothetical protein
MARTLRLGIEVDGKPKTLVKIRERREGDLIIVPLHGSFARELGSAEPDRKVQIEHQHYSIHRSTESVTDINMIKRTTLFSGKPPSKHSYVTKAIKSGDRIAPVFANRVPDLRLLEDKAKPLDMSLGSYEPKTWTLILYLFVAHRDFALTEPAAIAPCFDFLEHKISEFSLALFWTFAKIPSMPSGATIDFSPAHPNDGCNGPELVNLLQASTVAAVRDYYLSHPPIPSSFLFSSTGADNSEIRVVLE